MPKPLFFPRGNTTALIAKKFQELPENKMWGYLHNDWAAGTSHKQVQARTSDIHSLSLCAAIVTNTCQRNTCRYRGFIARVSP